MTRYLPLSQNDREKMLEKIGVLDIDELFSTIPKTARLTKKLDLPPNQAELSVEQQMKALASLNISAAELPFFCGAGAYRHHVPASVDHIIQRSEFLTTYTPYQSEMAQGTLQVMYEFQSQVAMLTEMDIANASMYDGSTASAEAALMAARITKRKKIVLSKNLHPHYAAAIKTLGDFASIEIDESENENITELITNETACLVVQNPDFYGEIKDLTKLADECHAKNVLLVVIITEIISLGLLKPPGAMGADIVAAEGQSLGNSLNFGGPYVGFLATKQEFLRQIPGRLCGRALDSKNRNGYVLTLAAREQHIRREKATSNICTSAGLCALAFSAHLALLGGEGLHNLAAINHSNAKKLARQLEKIDGVEVITKKFFNEFTIKTKHNGVKLIDRLLEKNIIGGVPVARLLPQDKSRHNQIIIAATEMNSDDDMGSFIKALKESI